MQIPKVEKIVLNMGVGDAVANAKVLDDAVEELTLITGQNRLLRKQRSPLRTLNYVKECRSAAK